MRGPHYQEIRDLLAKYAPDAKACDLDGFAESISVQAYLYKTRRVPHSYQGTEKAKISLVNVSDKIGSLMKALSTDYLDENATYAIRSADGPTPFEMMTKLEEWNEILHVAHKRLCDEQMHGTPKKAVEAFIESNVGPIFKRLTGLTDKRSSSAFAEPGKYMLFLNELWKIMGFSSSVETLLREKAQSKKAGASMEKRARKK